MDTQTFQSLFARTLRARERQRGLQKLRSDAFAALEPKIKEVFDLFGGALNLSIQIHPTGFYVEDQEGIWTLSVKTNNRETIAKATLVLAARDGETIPPPEWCISLWVTDDKNIILEVFQADAVSELAVAISMATNLLAIVEHKALAEQVDTPISSDANGDLFFRKVGRRLEVGLKHPVQA